MNIRIFFLLITILSFASCDPGADESIVIKNYAQVPVNIVVEKKGDYTDTIRCIKPFECNIPRTFVGDSLLVVHCNIEAGGVLILTRSQLIGEVQIKTKEIGMSYLKEISDSIYIVGQTMKKSFYDIDNWDLSVDINRYGGGVSQFSFTIENEDIE